MDIYTNKLRLNGLKILLDEKKCVESLQLYDKDGNPFPDLALCINMSKLAGKDVWDKYKSLLLIYDTNKKLTRPFTNDEIEKISHYPVSMHDNDTLVWKSNDKEFDVIAHFISKAFPKHRFRYIVERNGELDFETEVVRGDFEIKCVGGDVLSAQEECICHQVNCRGVMGAGLALQVAHRFPNVFREYKRLCLTTNPNALLGEAQFVKISRQRYLVNLFGQLNYGRMGTFTDYRAVERSLMKLRDFMLENNLKSVAFPYGMGAGLAGGNWNTIEEIIKDVFKNTNIRFSFYKI